jgi:16S rRNA (uracil1498-N3)-methyltransferase
MFNHKKQSHEFSLYWSQASHILGSVKNGESVANDDLNIYHRIVRVLRLKENERLIIFDRISHFKVQLETCVKKNTFILKVIERALNIQYKPAITFFLPVLKREALEHSIYSLVELGATDIRLMITHKTQRIWGGDKEFERLQSIMISAAEQSKNYAFPVLHEPQLFNDLLEIFSMNCCSFFFDPDGQDIFTMLQILRNEKSDAIFLMVGPEGDLTLEEKDALRGKNVQFCRLTPTILRALQAVALSMGIFRSLL